METGAKCGCNHSLAVICGVFVGIMVALLLAEDRCLDAGGKLSDTAWTCEVNSGTISSLWGLVTAGITAVAVFVGVLVYFAVTFFGRRWIFRYGKRRG
jgi:threonine/homoserine/homoserine lactone efflux protein